MSCKMEHKSEDIEHRNVRNLLENLHRPSASVGSSSGTDCLFLVVVAVERVVVEGRKVRVGTVAAVGYFVVLSTAFVAVIIVVVVAVVADTFW